MSSSHSSHHRLSQICQHLVSSPSSSSAVGSKLEEYLATQLSKHPSSSHTSLIKLISSFCEASVQISHILASQLVSKQNKSNNFGDEQLNVDISTHNTVVECLKQSKVVSVCSSEEQPEDIVLLTEEERRTNTSTFYSVSFDPLDGSSIIDANLAVGTIFSAWEGHGFLGRRVKDQAVSAITLYGPRTTIIFAVPSIGVFEATYLPPLPSTSSALKSTTAKSSGWYISHHQIQIRDGKTFAPANLRCAADFQPYNQLVQYYLKNKYTLRYSGGMVPDIYHILMKRQGIFLSPISAKAPAKLRLLYEVASLALIVTLAQGQAVNEKGQAILDLTIDKHEQRSAIITGSQKEVQRYIAAIQAKDIDKL